MSTVKVDLEQDLVALMHQSNRPVQDSAREMIVLELYRRGTISSGKAAELLKMARTDFVHYASGLGLPCLDMTEDEWDTEKRRSEEL